MVQARFSWLKIGTSHSPFHLPEILNLKIYTRVKTRTYDQIFFTTDVWAWRQASPCHICCEQSDNWTGVSTSTVAVP